MLQRCELASSSDERASEEKKLGKEPRDENDEPKIKKPRGKTPKNETNDDEDPPKTLKRPAAKKFKTDEFDGMFDDFQRGDGDDHSDPDADEGEGDLKKKKSKRRKKDDGDGKQHKKKQECHNLPISDVFYVCQKSPVDLL